MKVNEILNIRKVYKAFYNDDLSDELAVKIKTFLNETEYIEVDYHEVERSLLSQYGEPDENGIVKIIEDKNGKFFSIRKDKKDEFYDKISTVLLSPSKFHINEDMFLSDKDIEELFENKTNVKEARLVLESIRR